MPILGMIIKTFQAVDLVRPPILMYIDLNMIRAGVGSKGFVEKLKSVLIGSVSGRKVKEAGEGYQLREPSVPYKVNFDVKMTI